METKLEKLNEVIDYIENHLEEDIAMQDLAKIAGCSEFDFLRVFTFLCNISPSTYIRRRRMSLAAEALQKGYRVIDVALKYGYSNPVSFSRTFKEQFCILPSEIKDSSFFINMFPKFEFSIIKREDFSMKYRIVRVTKPICFIGIGKTIKDKKYNIIPKFWEHTQSNGDYSALEKFSIGFPFNKEYYEQNGINLCNVHGIGISEKDGKEKYVIGAFSDNNITAKYDKYCIPTGDYLVVSGDYNFSITWQNIGNWLSQSIYKRDKKHAYIELYAQTSDGKDYAEIWVPIVKEAIEIKNPEDIKSRNKECEFVLMPEYKFIGKTLHVDGKKSSGISEFWTAFNSDERNNELLKLPRLFKECTSFNGISMLGNACKETGELYYCDEPLIENDKTLFHWLLPVKKIF